MHVSAPLKTSGLTTAWAKVLSLELPQVSVSYVEGAAVSKSEDVWGSRSTGGVESRPKLLRGPPTATAKVQVPPSSLLNGAHVISGGLGSLGTLVGRSMTVSSGGSVQVVLLGRSATLSALKWAADACVTVVKVDGSFGEDVSELRDALMMPLSGVHHTSGTLTVRIFLYIQRKEHEWN